MTEKTVDYGRKLPVCLRKYDRGNPECDGRARARTPEERMPCVYRDRCVALQRLVRVKGYKARDLLKLRKVRDVDGKRRVYAFAMGESEAFQQWLTRAIDRYGIRNGRITIAHPDEDGGSPKPRKIRNRSDESKKKSAVALVKARQFATRALREKAREDLEATLLLLQWFVSRLQRATHRELAANQATAEDGQLFLIDRVESSRYVTLYVKVVKRASSNNRKRISRRPIACIILAVRTHSLQFRFPFGREELESFLPAPAVKKIAPADFVEGRYRSRTCQLGKEGASIVAEAIARAINRGTVEAREDLDATRLLVDLFVSRVKRATGREFATDRASAKDGQLFLIDRAESARYVTLCAKVTQRDTDDHRKRISRRPIARIILAAHAHSLQFCFPFDRDTLESLLPAHGAKALSPADLVEGRYLSRTCQVGKEGVSVVAEVIARAIGKGAIRIPKALTS